MPEVTQNTPSTPSTPSAPQIPSQQPIAPPRLTTEQILAAANATFDEEGNLEYQDPFNSDDPFAIHSQEDDSQISDDGNQEPVQPVTPPAQPVAAAPIVEPVQPAPVTPPVQQGPTPEEIQKQLAEQDKQFTNSLNQLYALDKAKVELLGEDHARAIQETAVKIHKQVMAHVTNMAQQVLPSVIEQSVNAREEKRKVETNFFEVFPQLNDPQYRQDVLNAAVAVNAANPRLDVTKKMLAVGAQACIMLGIDPTPIREKLGMSAPVLPQPSASPQPNASGNQLSRVAPPVPIRGNGGSTGPTPDRGQKPPANFVDEFVDLLAPIMRPSQVKQQKR